MPAQIFKVFLFLVASLVSLLAQAECTDDRVSASEKSEKLAHSVCEVVRQIPLRPVQKHREKKSFDQTTTYVTHDDQKPYLFHEISGIEEGKKRNIFEMAQKADAVKPGVLPYVYQIELVVNFQGIQPSDTVKITSFTAEGNALDTLTIKNGKNQFFIRASPGVDRVDFFIQSKKTHPISYTVKKLKYQTHVPGLTDLNKSKGLVTFKKDCTPPSIEEPQGEEVSNPYPKGIPWGITQIKEGANSQETQKLIQQYLLAPQTVAQKKILQEKLPLLLSEKKDVEKALANYDENSPTYRENEQLTAINSEIKLIRNQDEELSAKLIAKQTELTHFLQPLSADEQAFFQNSPPPLDQLKDELKLATQALNTQNKQLQRLENPPISSASNDLILQPFPGKNELFVVDTSPGTFITETSGKNIANKNALVNVLSKALRSLDPTQKFNIAVLGSYGTVLNYWKADNQLATPENISAAIEHLKKLGPNNTEDVSTAVKTIVDRKEADEVFLFSDFILDQGYTSDIIKNLGPDSSTLPTLNIINYNSGHRTEKAETDGVFDAARADIGYKYYPKIAKELAAKTGGAYLDVNLTDGAFKTKEVKPAATSEKNPALIEKKKQEIVQTRSSIENKNKTIEMATKLQPQMTQWNKLNNQLKDLQAQNKDIQSQLTDQQGKKSAATEEDKKQVAKLEDQKLFKEGEIQAIQTQIDSLNSEIATFAKNPLIPPELYK